MKRFNAILGVLLVLLVLGTVVFPFQAGAQSPAKISYQAVIRDTGGDLVTNQSVGMQISILQSSASGTPVYTETQSPTTNANGLVSIKIGEGTTSDDFSAIDWSSGPYFIKTETDPDGGTNYTITGTSQILSVPYAIHATTAETISGGITETDPVFSSWDKTSGISIMKNQILDFGSYLESESDPLYNSSVASGISFADINSWDNKLDNESDPVFSAWDKSSGISINESQISDLGSYLENESDPVFNSSEAAGITAFKIALWNNKLDSESDPFFTAWDKSTGILITTSQISNFGTYIESESDPIFSASVANGITGFDITNWNNKLDTETDPVFSAWDKSTGISITESQITDFGTYLETESDPVFGTSLAAGITGADTASWNSKLDTETQNLTDVLTFSNDGGAMQIKNIADPTDDQDAVTKSYVDELENRIFELEYNAGKDTVVDCDGNMYDILKFGDQYWFAENLKSTTYNDCTSIPKVEDAGTWSGLSTPAYCWYGNDSSLNAQNYGALYNWYAVNTGNLCPPGWRVASDEDWKALEMFVGMSQAGADSTGYRGNNEGAKLAGTGLWVMGVLTGEAEFGSSGFDVVPGGYRYQDGNYYLYEDYMGYQWSSTEYSPSNAMQRAIQYDRKTVYRDSGDKQYGMSVRCVRD
jgi:uncharacterized protein (TIGR02145 family)